ncbi:MAG: prepilin-type N-terminal cleavage/methylation domain-containing protein [Vulcanimicrobiota bacterium]
MARKSRGFSFIEVMVVIFLLSLMLGAGSLTLRKSVNRQGSKGLALSLASELRAVRAQAQRKQHYVAACFPNDGGTTPLSLAFAQREGADQGRLTRVRDFDRDYHAVFFIGTWPVAGTPMAAATTSGYTSGGTLDLTGWMAGADEYAVVFGPDGSVRSNGLPTVDGEIVVLVCGGAQATPGPDGYFQASGAVDPMSVVISPTGTIRVVPGVYRSTGLAATSGNLAVAATPKLPAVAGNTPPSIDEVSFFPTENPALKHSSLSQTYIRIHPQPPGEESLEYGLMTLVIKASDPEGGPLYFDCQCDSTDGLAGNFSTPNTGRMEWVKDHWEASVSWRPSNESKPGTTFEYVLTVTDPAGLTTVADSGSKLPTLDTIAAGRLAVESYDGVVRIGNLDGSDLARLTPEGEEDRAPHFTFDGTHLVTLSGTELRDVMVQNSDGTDRHLVKTLPEHVEALTLDPSSTQLAYAVEGEPQLVITTSGDEFSNDAYAIGTLHVVSGAGREITDKANAPGVWLPTKPKTLLYAEPAADDDDPQGWSLSKFVLELSGYPPRGSGVGLPEDSDTNYIEGAVYNPAYPLYAVFFSMRFDEADPEAPGTAVLKMAGPDGFQVTVAELQSMPLDPLKAVSWSGNGRALVYLDGSTIYVAPSGLGSSGDPDPPVGEAIDTGSLETISPRLSPDGRYAYFLGRTDSESPYDLYRIVVGSGVAPIQLTYGLGGAVNYDITR